jgi:D-glycero-alpha-D-manno-heptose-7-phosphate kinase
LLVVRSPLRVSLYGSASDSLEFIKANGEGVSLGFALDKYVYVSVNPNSPISEYKYQLFYSNVERRRHIDQIEHNLIREAIKYSNQTSPLEIHILSDICGSVGLGSSSTVTVGLLKALNPHYQPFDLALDAIDIERNVLAYEGGYQDQSFAALGGFKFLHYTFSGDNLQIKDSSKFKQSDIDNLVDHCLLIYTGTKRSASKVAGSYYNKIDKAEYGRLMVEWAYEARLCLNDIKRCGYILYKTWELKKNLSPLVSSFEVDKIVGEVMEYGAFGAKLLGAGGSGFIAALLPRELHQKFLTEYNYVGFSAGLSKNGAEIVYDSTV